MTVIHRINLKGPWQYEWLDGPHAVSGAPSREADSAGVSPVLSESRLKMPASIQEAFGSVTGRIHFTRRFQRPTNLDPAERVHLAFDAVRGTGHVSVNDASVLTLAGLTESGSADVTDLLQPSNLLVVKLSILPDDLAQPAGLFGVVAVEIHRA